MALWRDPLDELIDGLERTRVLDELQWAAGVILWGSEEERARVMHAQRFHDALKGFSGRDPTT